MTPDELTRRQWKKIYLWPYMVSNVGDVKRISSNRLLKPFFGRKRYLRVSLSVPGQTKMYFVHRLVAMAFISNPENHPTINHKDGDKNNNSVANLEWCTVKGNIIHARTVLGIHPINPHGKLNPDKVRRIRELMTAKSMMMKDLAALFGIAYQTLYKIKKGVIWKHVI